MTVAGVGEFGLIDRVTARLTYGESCLLGPGDDGAVVAAPDRRVVASTDVLVDGRHFRRDWSTARDIGHRAAAANLADIAAMGATPTALLVALCMPPELETRWAEELADGLGAEAALVGAGVVGGDMSASPTLTIAVTALGDLAGRPPVVRSGARPGDVVA
ncbi:MAG: AIR synthase related protein, partial [Micromonospora sp.]